MSISNWGRSRPSSVRAGRGSRSSSRRSPGSSRVGRTSWPPAGGEPRAGRGGGGWGGRLAGMAGRATSDAAAAEALVSVVETCCRESLSGELLLIEEPEILLTPQAQPYLYRLLP